MAGEGQWIKSQMDMDWTWHRATEKEAHVPNQKLEQARGCHYGQTSDKQCGGDIQRQLDRHHGAHSKLV